MNSVVLIGNLARDPELNYSPNTQMPICHFTLAVSRQRRNGEDQGADFIRITVFDRQAENCNRYLSKGSKVAVQGRIQTGSYKNREGVTVYTTDVVANNVEFLSSRQSGGQGGYQNNYQGGGNFNNGANFNNNGGFGGGQSFGGQSSGGFGGGQDTGNFGGPDDFGGNSGSAAAQNNDVFGGFDDLPDTFQAAEDDIPF